MVYVRYSLSIEQIIWAILTHSKVTEAAAEIEDLVVADAHMATVIADHDQVLVADETVDHDQVLVVDAVTDQRKCFQQHVMAVATNVKYHSNQVVRNQSIAAIVSKTKVVETSLRQKNHTNAQNAALKKVLVGEVVHQAPHNQVDFLKNNLIHCT